MNIALLAADLSQNSLGRVILLAQALATDHAVKIIGPCFGREVWKPAQDCSIEIESLPGDTFPQFALTALELVRRVRADLVVAGKPLLPSYGMALLCRRLKRLRVIVDIDDDEVAMTEPGRGRPLWRQLRDPLSHWHTRRCWAAVHRADGVISIARSYQETFGGVVVPHAKDTGVVDPRRHDRAASRQFIGLAADDEVVAFVGTPRPHKGIDLTLDAIEASGRPKLRLLLVGAEPDDSYVKSLQAQHPGRLVSVPPQPTSTMPMYLAAADIVALPQRANAAGKGQVPAKLFDAMAMAKPIVASRVGGIPEYLGDCGVLVPPDDVHSLTDAICALLLDQAGAAKLGQRARALCLTSYSFEAIRPLLNREIERALGGTAIAHPIRAR
jgi:glycosyltransferase involved in cell wall biosynthesis